jgi:hypothetical protein
MSSLRTVIVNYRSAGLAVECLRFVAKRQIEWVRSPREGE